MKYFSTRNKSLSFSFKDIFLRALAPDGGLFLPYDIKKYSDTEIKTLSRLSYVELATEIIFNFCKDDIEKNQLKILIEKAYNNFKHKEVVQGVNRVFVEELRSDQKAQLYKPIPDKYVEIDIFL